MPSLNSRTVDIATSHVRALPIESPAPILPTPHPPYLGRHPRMISSLPTIFATQDAALRQFYGNNLPGRRVSQT
jgi:hypothetical protein